MLGGNHVLASDLPAADIYGTIESLLHCVLATLSGGIAIRLTSVTAMLLGETAYTTAATTPNFAGRVGAAEGILLCRDMESVQNERQENESNQRRDSAS